MNHSNSCSSNPNPIVNNSRLRTYYMYVLLHTHVYLPNPIAINALRTKQLVLVLMISLIQCMLNVNERKMPFVSRKFRKIEEPLDEIQTMHVILTLIHFPCWPQNLPFKSNHFDFLKLKKLKNKNKKIKSLPCVHLHVKCYCYDIFCCYVVVYTRRTTHVFPCPFEDISRTFFILLNFNLPKVPVTDGQPWKLAAWE